MLLLFLSRVTDVGLRKSLLEKKKTSESSASSASAESESWMSDPAVVDVLDNGLECQQVEYADWMDRPLQMCWQCLCHDESSNLDSQQENFNLFGLMYLQSSDFFGPGC